jgi:hypothetical protein
MDFGFPMSTIASLDVDLALNSAKFVEGLHKARREHEDFTKSLQYMREGASKLSESLGIRVDADFSLGGIIEKAREAQESQAKLAAVLRATGEAAGFSAAGMARISEEMARVTSFSQEASRGAETVLATFTSVRGNQFEGAMKAAADLATVFNMDLSTAAEKLGRALENPADGLRSLAKMGVQFTESQKDTIRSLVDAGETAKAQQEIIAAVNAKVGGSAVSAANTAGGALRKLKNDYEELAATMGKVVLPAVTTTANAINGIAKAANSASSAIDTVKSIAGKAKSLFSMIGGGEGAGAGLTVGGGVAAGAAILGGAFIASSMEAYRTHQAVVAQAIDNEAEKHKEAAEAAQRHADALRKLAAEMKAISDKGSDTAQALIKESKASTQGGPLSTRMQEELWRRQAGMTHLQAGLPDHRGVNVVDTEWRKDYKTAVKSVHDLRSQLDFQKSDEAAGEATSQHHEMQSRADSIRQSIMSPLEKFQSTLRELSSLVNQNALDPVSAGIASRAALENLARSAASPQPVAAAALAEGSSGAYSAALRNSRDVDNPMLQVAQDQLKQMITDGTNFDTMVKTLQTIAGQSGNSQVVRM